MKKQASFAVDLDVDDATDKPQGRRPSTGSVNVGRFSSDEGNITRQSSSDSPDGRKSRKSEAPGKATKRNRATFIDSKSAKEAVAQQLEEERMENQALLEAQAHVGDTRCALISRRIVENSLFICLMTILTLYALASDDYRLMRTSKPADDWFNAMTMTCILSFTIEILLSCKGKLDYTFSFFFTLDCISTSTLILDLTFVNEALLQNDDEEMNDMSGSKTARVGARAARIVRVLRLVRLVKLYKAVYEVHAAKKRKAAHAAKLLQQQKKKESDEWTADDEDVDESATLLHESKVSKKLADMTTRRVIALVLSMMLGLPLLSSESNMTLMPTSANYGIETVFTAFKQMELNVSRREIYERALVQYVYYHNWYQRLRGCPEDRLCPADYYQSIFWVGIGGRREDLVMTNAKQAQVTNPGVIESYQQRTLGQERNFYVGSLPTSVMGRFGSAWNSTCRTKGGMLRRGFSLVDPSAEPSGSDLIAGYVVECPEDLRSVERIKYTPQFTTVEASKEWHFAFYVDNRPFVATEAAFNMATTVFICFVLLSFSMCITADANSMVLKPVETMILKVDMIRIDPLMATKLADDAFKKEEIDKAKAAKAHKSRSRRFLHCFFCIHEKAGPPMETLILEKTIIKLGTLLALGFGEAGANIIGQNMRGSGAVVQAMLPGVVVECIIGTARIREFEVATEILKVTVMQFVNQVAEIVHGVVAAHHGCANANKGDTFLTVWPCSLLEDGMKTKMADMAVLAFVRIWSSVHRSATLAHYRVHPGLQMKQRDMGIESRVNLTFGLHYGWAIEGAVGSEFKIDASYLSPNVNIAETVERATEVYKVTLMVTEAVMDICTPEMAQKGRLVSHVHMEGQKADTALRLYVIDLSYLFLSVEPPLLNMRWNTRQRFRCRQQLEVEKMSKIAEDVQIVTLWNSSLEINAMRAPFTLEFMYVFRMGYENFAQGEWKVARLILENTCIMLGFQDGPSMALLRYMELFGFECPEGWNGVHALKPDGHFGDPVVKVSLSNRLSASAENAAKRTAAPRLTMIDRAASLKASRRSNSSGGSDNSGGGDNRSGGSNLLLPPPPDEDMMIDSTEEKPIGTAERSLRC